MLNFALPDIKKLLIYLAILFYSFSSFANDIPKKPLKLSAQSFKVDSSYTIAINFLNHPGWHTYWKNPGDAGKSIELKFFSNEQDITYQFEPNEWPAPDKYVENGGLIANGYSDSYTLFFNYKPKNLIKLKEENITIHGRWLICKHICIPGEQKIEVTLKNELLVQTNSVSELQISQEILNQRFDSLPSNSSVPSNLEIFVSLDVKNEGYILFYSYHFGNIKHFNKKRSLLTPFPLEPFAFKHENLFIQNNTLYGMMKVDWDGIYQEPEIPLPSDGEFAKTYNFSFLFQNPESGKTFVITEPIKHFSVAGLETSLNFYQSLTPLKNDQKKNQSKETSNNENFFLYVLFAFIGGLILNFMPCVLPVISLKLFGLISHQETSRGVLIKHNFFYTMGVLTTFWVLALVIVLLQSSGKQIGWGFQLQSAEFLIFMIIILFVLSLNLFGLFEFSTPGGSKLGNLKLEDSHLGDFAAGVLTTILSTPCSAPFLGTALTFAFLSSPLIIVIIFTFMGLGLASPFILTAILPTTIRFLPRPGNWMITFKKFMGITILLTAVWLGDILLSVVATPRVLLFLNTVLIFIFLGFHFKNKKSQLISAASFWVAIAFSIFLYQSELLHSETKSDYLLQEKKALGLPWNRWSSEKMTGGDKIKFIDFTAKWCFTCKVNERLVLHTKDFSNLVQKYDLELYLADWTQYDEEITKWLKENGKVGVPAYFIIKKDGSIIDLGETISINEIEKNLII